VFFYHVLVELSGEECSGFSKMLGLHVMPSNRIFRTIKDVLDNDEKYKSDAFAAIHETMEGLHGIGAIDKQTMRQFDASCLSSVQELSL
jgi:hypothetical protein